MVRTYKTWFKKSMQVVLAIDSNAVSFKLLIAPYYLKSEHEKDTRKLTKTWIELQNMKEMFKNQWPSYNNLWVFKFKFCIKRYIKK